MWPRTSARKLLKTHRAEIRRADRSIFMISFIWGERKKREGGDIDIVFVIHAFKTIFTRVTAAVKDADSNDEYNPQ